MADVVLAAQAPQSVMRILKIASLTIYAHTSTTPAEVQGKLTLTSPYQLRIDSINTVLVTRTAEPPLTVRWTTRPLVL